MHHTCHYNLKIALCESAVYIFNPATISACILCCDVCKSQVFLWRSHDWSWDTVAAVLLLSINYLSFSLIPSDDDSTMVTKYGDSFSLLYRHIGRWFSKLCKLQVIMWRPQTIGCQVSHADWNKWWYYLIHGQQGCIKPWSGFGMAYKYNYHACGFTTTKLLATSLHYIDILLGLCQTTQIQAR